MADPINPLNDVTVVVPPTVSNLKPSGNTVDKDTFLKLLVAQLKYQDPSHPVDNSTLMSQTATLNQITTMQQLATASVNQMQAQQQQTAADMVGKTVTYLDSAGALQGGLVSAATISGTTPTLTIGGQIVGLAQVQQVTMTAT